MPSLMQSKLNAPRILQVCWYGEANMCFAVHGSLLWLGRVICLPSGCFGCSRWPATACPMHSCRCEQWMLCMELNTHLFALVLLQIHKVASYCMSKLQELNIHLDMRPQYLRRPPHAPPEEPPEGPSGRPALELLCNGMVRAGRWRVRAGGWRLGAGVGVREGGGEWQGQGFTQSAGGGW